jgi:1-deoxy-D-xylulose-5-phosphate reductoisomerase
MSEVRQILLTASGGPFAGQPDVDLATVTVDQALKHPRWNMGRKVTVDSATLMNKGLEVMEAQWLFDVPLERIEVVIHPESLVHSLVEYVDGSLLAQLSVPDMRLAIQYALTWPERCEGGLPRLSLAQAKTLTFLPPDDRRFACLALARRAAVQGGVAPAVLNAANEVAVDRFLAREIPFPGIWRLVESVLDAHRPEATPSMETILAADGWARRVARAWRPD